MPPPPHHTATPVLSLQIHTHDGLPALDMNVEDGRLTPYQLGLVVGYLQGGAHRAGASLRHELEKIESGGGEAFGRGEAHGIQEALCPLAATSLQIRNESDGDA